MTDYGSPQNADLIREGVASALLDLHVATPGIVQSYDDATQTCSVQPAVKRPLPVEDGTLILDAPEVVQNVPVLVFGSPKLSAQVELAKGDTVLLVYLDFSPAAWRGSGVQSDPHDTRQSGPAYPVAIPWHRPAGKAGPDAQNTIGASDSASARFVFTASTIAAGTGSDFVAMAQKVDAALANIQTTLASFGTTQAAASTGPLAALASGFTGLATAMGTPAAPTASTNLKAD